MINVKKFVGMTFIAEDDSWADMKHPTDTLTIYQIRRAKVANLRENDLMFRKDKEFLEKHVGEEYVFIDYRAIFIGTNPFGTKAGVDIKDVLIPLKEFEKMVEKRNDEIREDMDDPEIDFTSPEFDPEVYALCIFLNGAEYADEKKITEELSGALLKPISPEALNAEISAEAKEYDLGKYVGKYMLDYEQGWANHDGIIISLAVRQVLSIDVRYLTKKDLEKMTKKDRYIYDNRIEGSDRPEKFIVINTRNVFVYTNHACEDTIKVKTSFYVNEYETFKGDVKDYEEENEENEEGNKYDPIFRAWRYFVGGRIAEENEVKETLSSVIMRKEIDGIRDPMRDL